ncbi:MAG: chromate efflux transporter [Chloroflexota bacterium]|nr:chromate efflux transporter [Chloroflexota bacterium]
MSRDTVAGTAPQSEASVREVAAVAVKLGFTAFGGPAAHIAMLRDEVVVRRRWLSEQHFLDLLGATNLIPGPNSTEMVIHVGQARAGWRGLLVGGALFILPAALIVLVLAWAYVRFGSLPQTGWLLYGIKPVIIAVVLQALWGLSRTALRGRLSAVLGVAVTLLYLLGVNEILLLFGGGLFMLVARRRPRGLSAVALPPLSLLASPAVVGSAPVSTASLFLTFLKIGAVLYGSGYVLLAFLRNDFVDRLGWISDQQLLDAVALGQVTPGPVFTTATFIGYVVAGLPGAVLATVGIFLPSFLFVALVNPLVPRLRSSATMSALLDGLNVAAVGLMAAVTWELGRAALVDALTVLLAVASAVLLIRYRVNSAWLVLLGGFVGIAYRLLSG